jgi:hypothetical protein
MRESRENMEAVASFFFFLVCQETGRTALMFYCAIAKETVKIYFISNVSTSNVTLRCRQHAAFKLQAA